MIPNSHADCTMVSQNLARRPRSVGGSKYHWRLAGAKSPLDHGLNMDETRVLSIFLAP